MKKRAAALHGSVVVTHVQVLDAHPSEQDELVIMRPSFVDEASYVPAESISLHGKAIRELLAFLQDAVQP